MLWHMAVQDASSLGLVFVSTRLEQTFRMLPQTRIKGLTPASPLCLALFYYFFTF